MKHFIDIENLREFDIDLGDGRVRKSNAGAFQIGNEIHVSCKVDGSNGSFRYNEETGKLDVFSRKRELDYKNTLDGFWNFIQTYPWDMEELAQQPNWIYFGEWLCLSGDTKIKKASAGRNSSWMTIREMYEFLNSPSKDGFHGNQHCGSHGILCNLHEKNGLSYDELYENYKGLLEKRLKDKHKALKKAITWATNNEYINKKDEKFYITNKGEKELNDFLIKNNWWHRYGLPNIFSLDFETDTIRKNQIVDIFYSGVKDVYKITTRKGFSIKATKEHPFLTPKGFIPLGELKELDCVAVTSFTTPSKARNIGKYTKLINTLQQDHKKRIGHCEICGATTCLDLHHIDGDYTNNVLENWQVLCRDCHNNIHKKDKKFKGFEYEYEFDFIEDIEYIGKEDCYDISMKGEETWANFVAENFIVHNCRRHIVQYPQEMYKQWYVYDIWDTELERYLPAKFVEAFAKNNNLNYIETFYEGPFISWDHVRSFCHASKYGEHQEGVVCRLSGSDAFRDYDSHNPPFLKIVNDEYKETSIQQHIKKIQDPEKLEEKARCQELCESIVTEQRVNKEINKMIDEGILPSEITPKEMSIVARNLPNRIYEDCVKEEPEIVYSAGKYAGKIISSLSMMIAKNIILGG